MMQSSIWIYFQYSVKRVTHQIAPPTNNISVSIEIQPVVYWTYNQSEKLDHKCPFHQWININYYISMWILTKMITVKRRRINFSQWRIYYAIMNCLASQVSISLYCLPWQVTGWLWALSPTLCYFTHPSKTCDLHVTSVIQLPHFHFFSVIFSAPGFEPKQTEWQ